MIPVYTAMAIAAMSLPVLFHHGLTDRSPQGVAAAVPGIDLPEVDRLEIVLPPVQRVSHDTLPNFIEPPTLTLEVVVPEGEPHPLKPPARPIRMPAPTPIHPFE